MKLKTLIMGLLLVAGTAFGQSWNTNYPTNVRYIAGGYSNQRPYFSTLNTALNDVKAYATSDNPYTFWLMSDTLNIADWDSVYNSGVNMSDSIYTYYVAAGKIKWAGFAIDTAKGGIGGSSVLNFESMAATTDNYTFARWDSSGNALSAWQIQLALTLMKLDSLINARTLFNQVNPIYLSISGDSLIFSMPSMVFNKDSFYTIYFDSTTYVRTTGDQNIVGTKTIGAGGILDFAVPAGPLAGGQFLVPSDPHTTPRGFWGDGTYLYYYAGGKVIQLARVDSIAGILLGTIVDWTNLVQAVKDSAQNSWLTESVMPDDSTTVSTGDIYFNSADGIIRRKY